MAITPISKRPLPFNIPTGLDAIKARDAPFWRAWASWRLIEDELAMRPGEPDSDPRSRALLEQAHAARLALLGLGVRSACALSAKFAALQEAGASATVRIEVCPGFSIADVLQADVERLAKLEMFGPAAFEDMATG